MYLVCKYIRENTDIKVLLTGEVSDELFGYRYTDYAPNSFEFQKEADKRISELHMYDLLRADRCIARWGLEARVPYGDPSFVKYVQSINPEYKLNKNNIGKELLRKSFNNDDLPHDILYRVKEAFSDAVGLSMVVHLKNYAEKLYSDDELKKNKYSYYCPPISKESLLYRDIFEKYYPGCANMISGYWMPNKEWDECKNINDPSARYLPLYN
jgi:asparagine synthase (glutamine-hydrolysing)